MNTETIIQWQKEFRAAPLIWYTTRRVDGQEEDTGNFYDSKEAAEVEKANVEARGQRCRIRCANIHNLDLSQRRWTSTLQS